MEEVGLEEMPFIFANILLVKMVSVGAREH